MRFLLIVIFCNFGLVSVCSSQEADLQRFFRMHHPLFAKKLATVEYYQKETKTFPGVANATVRASHVVFMGDNSKTAVLEIPDGARVSDLTVTSKETIRKWQSRIMLLNKSYVATVDPKRDSEKPVLVFLESSNVATNVSYAKSAYQFFELGISWSEFIKMENVDVIAWNENKSKGIGTLEISAENVKNIPGKSKIVAIFSLMNGACQQTKISATTSNDGSPAEIFREYHYADLDGYPVIQRVEEVLRISEVIHSSEIELVGYNFDPTISEAEFYVGHVGLPEPPNMVSSSDSSGWFVRAAIVSTIVFFLFLVWKWKLGKKE